MVYDALHTLISVFATGDYTTNEQLFRDCDGDDVPALMLQLLGTTFENEPVKRKNFFRGLTHDHCQHRHAILEPDLLEQACPLDNGRHHFPRSSAPASLFDKLPLEILRQIFIELLDLESVTTLRAVDSRIRSSIDLLPEYQDIIQYSPTSIRAALSLNVASAIGCRTLHDFLCDPTCSTCGAFGAFLYLPTCQRVCRPCFTTKPEFLPVPLNYAKAYWDITSQDLVVAGMPFIKSLPGVYRAGFYSKTRGRTTLVHKSSAIEVATRVHGSLEQAASFREAKLEKWQDEVEASALLPPEERKGRPCKPVHCFPADDKQAANSHRSMCIVGFPWLNKLAGRVEWGVACRGCFCHFYARRDGSQPVVDWLKAPSLYSEQQFLNHFVQCPHARRVFFERFGKLNGDEMLLPPGEVCDVAGDLSGVQAMADKHGNPQTSVLDRVMWRDPQKHLDIRKDWADGFNKV